MSDSDDIDAALAARAAQGQRSGTVTANDSDDIDRALAARAAAKPSDDSGKPAPTSAWEKAKGAADIVGTGLLNIPHATMGAAHDLYSRITGNGENTSAPAEFHLGDSGQRLVQDVVNSDTGKAIGNAYHYADRALETASPTLHDVAHQTLGVAGDVANLMPLEAGAAGFGKGFGKATAEGVADAAAGGRAGQVALLKQEGIPLSTAQETGGKLAQHLERASAMTGDGAGDFAQTQAEAFNRAVLKRAGITDPNVTAAHPDVLGAAKDRITGVMNDVAKRNPVPVDDTLLSHLSDMHSEVDKTLTKDGASLVKNNIDDIINHADANGGKLDGTYLQKINTRLGKLSKDPNAAPVIGELQEHLADALDRHADPADVKALAEARQQYRVLKQVEPAIDPTTGNISPSKLMNSMNVKANRNQSLYGRGDQSLVNLAKAGKNILPDKLGNSGTAERMLPAQGALETLGSGQPIAAATKAIAGPLFLNQVGKVLRGQPGTVAGGLKATARPALKGLKGPALFGIAPKDQQEQ